VSSKVRAELWSASLRARVHRRRVAHFLHIGKTAGSAIRRALREAPPSPTYDIARHTHGVRLADLPRGDKFFFVVRDPLDRFVSGFYSRLRQGAPKYVDPWTADEERAFERFPTPSALGLGLAGSGQERVAAVDAMRSIGHVRTSYWDWFGSEPALRRRSGDLLFVGYQEMLDDQVPDLARCLSLPTLELPRDPAVAHRTADDVDRTLAPEARAALERWYEREFDFVDLCRELRPPVLDRRVW
jgi:hypothetical protein